jgi:hypothetical protein
MSMALDGDWHDPLILRLLLEEATLMIEGNAATQGAANPTSN